MSDAPRIFRNLRVPMRDGATLGTDVYLPARGDRFPVVLVRTAYNRALYCDGFFPTNGIAYVVQDCRGRYDGEGYHYPFIYEADDGQDTLAWLNAQPWCNGRIGMTGDSYLAATQLFLAPVADDSLVALNPGFMAGDCWKHAYYVDGVFSLALTWSWLCFECPSRVSQAPLMPRFNVLETLKHLPILTMDEAFGSAPVRAYRDYVSNNRYTALWDRINVRNQAGGFRAPVLLTGGWYDNYAAETFANFQALRDAAPTPALRESHRLLMGPWTHGMSGSATLGQLDFGPAAQEENTHRQRWLATLLAGGTPAEAQPAPLRLFVMGLNQWRDEYEWPLARTQWTKLYLGADGTLAAQPPAQAAPDRYVYDPADPCPTLGGNHSVGPYNPGLYEHALPGPYDQRPIEARADVLTYTSDVLPKDLELTGPITLTLYAATSAPDTDFVAKLTDVHPDGRSMNVTEGALRARFRRGVWQEPELLTPSEPYEFTLDLGITSMLFKAGHRLRLLITSSNFPLWDRNLNTGHDPATATEIRTAEQTLFHDATRPSHLVLPVIMKLS